LGLVNGVVCHGGSKARSGSSSKSVSRSTTEQSSGNNGSHDDTSDGTSSKTSNQTDRRNDRTVSSFFDVTSRKSGTSFSVTEFVFVVDLVSFFSRAATGESTVVGVGTNERFLDASIDDIAVSGVTNVVFYASNVFVMTRTSSSGGVGPTGVDGAGASVIASGRDVGVIAAGGGEANIDGASVHVVTEISRDGIVLANGGLVVHLVRPEARINGASIHVVAFGVEDASRRRTMKIFGIDQTGGWVASVSEALV